MNILSLSDYMKSSDSDSNQAVYNWKQNFS